MAIQTSIIVSTTFDVQGRRIREYKGVVRGITVRAPTIAQGILGGLKSIIGGQIGAYTEMCEQARQAAYDLMIEHARELGANAVVGMCFDASEVASKASDASKHIDRKSTRLNSSHVKISYAVFCLKKKKKKKIKHNKVINKHNIENNKH